MRCLVDGSSTETVLRLGLVPGIFVKGLTRSPSAASLLRFVVHQRMPFAAGGSAAVQPESDVKVSA